MLDQMSPWDYPTIRVALGHGAGFDSPGFSASPARRATQRLSQAFDTPRSQRRRASSSTDLYRRGREFEDLYQLAELLTDWDERIWIWRFRHYAVVARALGEDTHRHAGNARAGARQADRPAAAAPAVGRAAAAGRAVRRRARRPDEPPGTLHRDRASPATNRSTSSAVL